MKNVFIIGIVVISLVLSCSGCTSNNTTQISENIGMN